MDLRSLPMMVACGLVLGHLAIAGQTAQTYFQRGRDAFEAHDDSGEAMREAEADFQRALKLDPRHAPSVAYLGMIRADRGEREAAETLYRRALALDAACAEALVGLARFRWEDGRKDEAMSLLRKAVAARPENHLALWELASLLSGENSTTEDWKEAARCWQTLIRLDPNDRDAHELLARAYRKFEWWAEAEREYREVLRIGQLPDDGDVWVYTVHGDVAEMLEKQGRLRAAIDEWKELAAAEGVGEEEVRRARERIAELERALKATR